jgi:GntR family transcriptional regulator
MEYGTGARAGRAAERPAAAPAPAPRSLVLDIVGREFERLNAAGMTKYMQLHKAILGSVETGLLRPGDQIPPEDLLTTNLGISLGTIRRALAHLAAGGVVTREHGRGTFIASHSRALGDSWHFRFVAEDGRSLLPVYSHVIARDLVREHGAWARALGRTGAGYVRITRCFNVDDRFLSYSEFYLLHDRFGTMMTWPLDELENVNLKKVLNERFGLPTIQITQRARVARFPDHACDLMNLRRRTSGMLLEIVAYTLANHPLSYHVIHVPPVEYPIDLSFVQVAPGTKGVVD